MKNNHYTQRTLKLLTGQGWRCGIVERFIPHINIRKDLFGIIDIIAISGDKLIGVQSTSWAQRGPHLKKLKVACHDETMAWLKTHNGLWLVTWRKVLKKPGGKAMIWAPHVDLIDLPA